jgi:hypothetical protein
MVVIDIIHPWIWVAHLGFHLPLNRQLPNEPEKKRFLETLFS